MRSARNGAAKEIMLLSGDGDFVSLVHELMHMGVNVQVHAFSSGLNPAMETSGDAFRLLDDVFFLTDAEIAAASGPG